MIHDSCLHLRLRDKIWVKFNLLLVPMRKEQLEMEHHQLNDLQLHKKRWLDLLNNLTSLIIRKTLAFCHKLL